MSAPSVFVIGETLIDAVDAHGSRVEHVGGSPANVAIGVARQGIDVTLLTRFGRDERGRVIRDVMDAAGVALAPGSEQPESTSIAFAHLSEDGSASYTFDITWAIQPWAPSVPPTVVHTGSIAAFLQPGAGSVLQLIREAAGKSSITFDPNIRPALLGDKEEVRSRFEALAALADVVKLSDEDAAWLYPSLSPREVLDRITGLGCRVTAMTRGADGALLMTRDGVFEVVPVKVTVADTIGAGDAFMSSIVSDLATHGLAAVEANPRALGARAAAAAAITVSRVGADLPWARDIERMMTADLPAAHQPMP